MAPRPLRVASTKTGGHPETSGADVDNHRVPRAVLHPPQERGLWVCETFTTLQGEGNTSGLPTVFLRTTGCHLRCRWCDTEYSFQEGEWTPWETLRSLLDAADVKRLCLTGGEPLLQRDAWALVRDLLEDDWQVTIETSGSLPLAEASRIRDTLGETARRRLTLSVDVKCPRSGESRSWHKDNLNHLTPTDQLKFIIVDLEDYEWAKNWVQQRTPLPCPVWFHPEGGVDGKMLTMIADRLVEDRMEVRLGVQLHKLVWGEKRGV